MIAVYIIDNENAIARFVDEDGKRIVVFDDEIRALNAIENTKPAVIIVNYTVLQTDTTRFISLLFKVSRQSKIVLIAQRLTDDEILDCLAAGTKGYLQMHEVEKFINKLITVITNGEAWISRRLVSKLLERLQNQKISRNGIADEPV